MRYDAAWHKRFHEIRADLPFRSAPERVAIRKALAADPVAFAMLYLSHHLKDAEGRITFSEVHYDWARIAESWRGVSQPHESRHAFIAPRETGKSTWWFLILPLWAAANGVRQFAVAFAHADSQATGHLATFKRELDTNALLRADFPELCEPARKPSSGSTLADRQGMLHTQSGFVFAARGVDTASLGLKVGEIRPDLLVFDDIEPDEARYSPVLAKKRLGTIQDALLPLNIRAAVVMVGTVTMPGSIMHQLVRVAHGSDDEELKWIRDEKIEPHHHEPILPNGDGTERSMWPEKWPIAFLLGIRHTRSFAKNYLNDPMGRDGDYWTADDFRYGTVGAEATRWILQLDPAVTTKGTSDYTGWAVVAYRPPVRVPRTMPDSGITVQVVAKPVAEVVASGKIRLTGEPLRAFVLAKLTEYERIKAVRVEVNQGGELWYTILHSLPAKLLVHTSNESKEVRFAYALDLYQRGHVLHRERQRECEEQMIAFPNAPYDDIADAAVCGILFFLSDVPRLPTHVETRSYV
jgi:hypothetical protein